MGFFLLLPIQFTYVSHQLVNAIYFLGISLLLLLSVVIYLLLLFYFELVFVCASSCRFLVIADAMVAGYSLIQGSRCVVSMIKGSVLVDKALALGIFSCDQVCGKFFGAEPLLLLDLQTCIVRLVLFMSSILRA